MGEAARQDAHRGGDGRSRPSARKRGGGEGGRGALRPARGRPPHSSMEGREAVEPPAGARARGALPPARRPREGDRRRRATDRPSRRRSGRDGAVPSVARVRGRRTARHGADDHPRRHDDRPAAHRAQKARPHRLRPRRAARRSSTTRPTPTRGSRAPACARFLPGSARKASTPRLSIGWRAAPAKPSRRSRI